LASRQKQIAAHKNPFIPIAVSIIEVKIDHHNSIKRRWGLPTSRIPMLKSRHLNSERNFKVNKSELVDAIAADTEISKAAAQRALDSVVENIIKAVTKGDTVQLVGFGSFSTGKRAARTGRNPQTGEEIKIAAATTVKFSAGKSFKEAVNKKKK